ncbi:hypothetical protein LINPERPRIM_LOCUS10048, partial [Linum perenne]
PAVHLESGRFVCEFATLCVARLPPERKQRTAIAGEFEFDHADSLNFQVWVSISFIVCSC